MSIIFVLLVAVVVAVLVAGVAFFLRRLTEDGRPGPPEEPPERAPREPAVENAWRDKFLFPLLVSIVSGVVVALVLYLLGIK